MTLEIYSSIKNAITRAREFAQSPTDQGNKQVRVPHLTCSPSAMVGELRNAGCGGVLVLDEFVQMKPETIGALGGALSATAPSLQPALVIVVVIPDDQLDKKSWQLIHEFRRLSGLDLFRDAEWEYEARVAAGLLLNDIIEGS